MLTGKRVQAILSFFAITVLLWHIDQLRFIKLDPPGFKLPDYLKPRLPDLHPDPAHLYQGENGAVASDVDICSKMAVELMRDEGGNAIDAAVLTTLCIGSINSFSSGIGGGGFMTVRTPEGESIAFNFREMAPGKAFKDMYIHDPMSSQIGGLAVAIPGEVAGLEAAHKKYGQLPWKQCIDPVVRLNREGFVVPPYLAAALKNDEEHIFNNKDEWLNWLVDDRLAEPGDVIKRENLADTLELIANDGAQVFYDPNGPIAPYLAETTQNHGGILTAEDFAHFTVEETEPLIGEFLGNRQIITTPNPTSGPALILGLNIIQQFEENEELGNMETHHLVEAMKFMASGRSELGDLRPNQSHIDELTSKEYALQLKNKITNITHPWQYYDPAYEPNRPNGTAHFSVLDKDNMAVALTTTVNLEFGAKIIDKKTGIILNSEMDDFSTPNTSNYFGLAPSLYNYIRPYNRPLSSTVPTIVVKDGKVEIVIGAAGGSHITTAVLEAIVRLTKYGTSLLDAIAFPRVHHQLLPDEVMLELGTPCFVQQNLEERGHKVGSIDPATAMNGIHVPCPKVIHAVSDWWRKKAGAFAY